MATTPLQIPEIALIIIGHLDPPTTLSIRLVSSRINALILSDQRSISRSIAQRHYSIDIDWPPPDVDGLQQNFHLRTLTRLPKAYKLARRANTQYECHVETISFAKKTCGTVMKPTPSYAAFLARCTRAILTIWTLNDIRQNLAEAGPLPSYVSPSPSPSPFHRQGVLGRFFSRMTATSSEPGSASLSPAEANAQNITLYIASLRSKSLLEFYEWPPAFSAARQTYLQSIPRDHLIDLSWVKEYLYHGLPWDTRSRQGSRYYEKLYALQQSPNFILSLCSDDKCEKAWAWSLVRKVFELSQNGPPIDFFRQWETHLMPLLEDSHLSGEAQMAKAELTRGDWRHGGRIG